MTDALRQAPRLPLERMPALPAVFEKVSQACIEAFRDYCAAPVTAFVNQLDLTQSWDMLEVFEDSIGVIFHASDWDVPVLIGLERRFVFALLEGMYGGDGTEKPFETSRPFTSLEMKLGRAVCDIAAAALQEALQPSAPLTLTFEKIEGRLEFTSLGPKDMTVLTVQILFQVLDQGGRLFVLIPQAGLYPIRKSFEQTRSVAAPASAKDPLWQEKMQAGVSTAQVELAASLDALPMTLTDIVNLAEGDMIALADDDRNVLLSCEGQPVFVGALGQDKGMLTVTIERGMTAPAKPAV
jgi:flagellar motor switch protein FliM